MFKTSRKPLRLFILGLSCIMQLIFLPSSQAQEQINRNTKDNTVKTITFKENSGPAITNVTTALAKYLELSSEHTLKLKYADTQENGVIIQKYTQWYNNIQAEHGSVSVMAANGRITFINANIYKPTAALAAAPAISEQQALNKALGNINAQEYMWENVRPSKLTQNNPSFQYPVGRLVWVEDFTQDELNKQLHLAYRFDIYATKPVSREVIYVDAVTGNILLKDAVIKHVGATGTSLYSGNVNFNVANTASNTYEMYDSNRLVSTYDIGGGTDFGFADLISNNSTTFSKSVAVDAHWGATKVYDYWLNEHSRNSYDNNGADMYSIVNYDIAYNNAFWNGFTMVYGNGTGMFFNGFEPLASLDVCAHEIGHAVCEYTANLVYQRESGAMNEGFSDIWGAVIENYAVADKQMWSIGEELRVGALRSMSNPNLFNDPDTYDGLHWVSMIGCTPNQGNDYCGVHNNSGVLNYWFYLLTDGGKGTNDVNNAFEVAGIGVKKAARIAYAAEQMLNSTDDFLDCRNATIAAATTFYGACSREVEAVTRAWYAVNVGAAFIPCNPQIGFALSDTTISKVVPGIICPSSKIISIPVRIIGNAPAGGNATVTFLGAGTAINGADYTVANSPLTFNAGSTATQNVQVNILDNGDVTKNKTLKLYLTITQNGSNATVSYTYDTCYITIIGERNIPDTGADVKSKVNPTNLKSKAVTPFFSRNAMARSQFIVTAEELTAAGLRANQPITALEFNVTEKNSTQAFSNFTLKIDATTAKDLTGGNPTVTTVYYNGNYTTQSGWNTLPLSANLLWNGTDNLAIETCFTNANAGNDNDYIEASGTDNFATSVAYADGGGSGCSLLFTSNFYFSSISKPVVRLVQPTNVVGVETTIAGSRPWAVGAGQNTYFTSTANDKLIANIANANANMGCVNTFVSKQGNGLTPLAAPFSAASKSVKEFTVVASANQATTQYQATLYFDTTELTGVNLANAMLIATTATQDSLMNTDNTVLASVSQTQGKGYQAFAAQLTGIYPRYYLIDKAITIPPPQSIDVIAKNSGNIIVVNNPFTDKIYLKYNLLSESKAQVRLYDIAGKEVYVKEQELKAGQHSFEINLSDKLMAPGNYVLQIVTDSEVMTIKMLKQ